MHRFVNPSIDNDTIREKVALDVCACTLTLCPRKHPRCVIAVLVVQAALGSSSHAQSAGSAEPNMGAADEVDGQDEVVAAPFAAAAGILAVGLRAFGAAGAAGAGRPLTGSTGHSHRAHGYRGGREGGSASSGGGSPLLYVACAHVFVFSAVPYRGAVCRLLSWPRRRRPQRRRPRRRRPRRRRRELRWRLPSVVRGLRACVCVQRGL